MKPVYQAKYFKKYTPSSNELPYQNVVVMFSADCTADVVDRDDNVELAVPFKASIPYAFSFKKITAVSTGNVYLAHNKDATIEGA